MMRVDSELRVCEINQDLARHFGVTPTEAGGSSVLRFIHRSGHERLSRQFARVLEGRRTRISEQVLVVPANRDPGPCRLTAIAIDGPGGLVVLFEPDDTVAPSDAVAADAKVLSPLDARILEGIAAGVSTVGLASKCYLSRQGVEYRVGMMLRHMRVPNRAALVSKAYAMGVFSIGVWPPRVLADFVD